MLDVRNIDERLLNDDKDLEVNVSAAALTWTAHVSAGEIILNKDQIKKLAEMFKREYRSSVWVR